jgi:hypothetical protein
MYFPPLHSITTDSQIDFEYGIFAPGSSDDYSKKFERYHVKYLGNSNTERSIKVPLSPIEVGILTKIIAPAVPLS